MKNKSELVVPSVQRRASIKSGDRSGAIMITPAKASTYKPTKSELAAIREGEAAISRGDVVSLAEFLNGLACPNSL